jgi:aminopeptidase N
MKSLLLIVLSGACIVKFSAAQPFTHQDTLRGSVTPERAWWDLSFYDLAINVDIDHKMIQGSNTITYNVIAPGQTLQIDLQEPLVITKADYHGQAVTFDREGNVYWVHLPNVVPPGIRDQITIYYEGSPREAKRPPWDGGFTWSKDEQGHPFVATSCQGIGASIWWPCKDHMYDEVDSMSIRITVPPGVMDVSNGRLRHIDYLPDGRRTYQWFVANPINNYGVNANIAQYTHWSDTLHGESGVLDLDFYVLMDHYAKAKEQFKDVYRTLRAFEYWFGPYPFYKDGYKLVEVPYLGMEHQSSVTYGNGFKNGYLGRDLSSTGWGLKWDFIIVHESAHEWWANSITYKDIADMWIHESFANYAENLFTEYYYGKKAGSDYVVGTRLNIENKEPIIAPYNVNQEGSRDMYYKGGNMLHTLRQWVDDDEKWRNILRGLQHDFYHQTVTTAQVEHYIAEKSGFDLSAFFNQYLRDIRIPTLEYKIKGKKITYRYGNIVPGFTMPVKISINGGEELWIHPNAEWQELKSATLVDSVRVDRDFYIFSQEEEK